MTRLDRYLFMQILGPFGFFALVLVGILWLAQALPLIDPVIENGQSALVFAEVSAMLLPRVTMVALPLASMAATLYALNRMYSEAEVVVAMASGQSPWALARPVAMFGLMSCTLMYVLTLYLVPASQTQMRDRLYDIRTELANSLVREGQFLHPQDDLTLFITEAGRSGELVGLFLHDQRNPEIPVTYSAERALFLQDGDTARIVMVSGVAQRYSSADGILNMVRFDRFSYEFPSMLPGMGSRVRGPFEMFVPELLNPAPEVLEAGGFSRADFRAEALDKLTLPLAALTLPLVGLGAIVAGGFRRGGFGGRVTVAVILGILLQSSNTSLKATVQRLPELPWLMALPALTALALALLLLHQAARTPRRALPVGPQGAAA